jgi:Anti-sigma-K factor rskA
VAAAAAIVIALLGIQVVRLQIRTNHLSSEMTALENGPQPTMATVNQALAEPGAQLIELRPSTGGPVAIEAVVLPSGSGYLYESRLTPLPSSQTYQLWGIAGSEAISYGLIGSIPAEVTAFRVGSGAAELAITAEEAGGVTTPSQSPLAVGPIKHAS